jgi:hypothetical protein
VLIDRTHTRWAVGTLVLAAGALTLRAWLGWDRPGGLTGGTTAGLWFGVVGSLLMIYAGLLAVHRRLPVRRWLGKRQTWLRAHIWLGSLSAVVIYCHSGPRLGGPLEIALWVVLAITIGSGVLLLIVQAVLPRLITQRIPFEAPYEQIPHLCLRMRQEADEALDEALAVPEPAPGFGDEVRSLHEGVRGFLAESFDRASPLAEPWHAAPLFERARRMAGLAEAPDKKAVLAGAVDRLERLCVERRQLGEQERMHFWLHVWLLLHIPITVVLLVLGTIHAVMSVYW